nr:reverse transcriptase domain-containing protein [Mesoplasma melaleucae]
MVCFLSNASFFNELFNFIKTKNGKMSIYVDDIFLSFKNENQLQETINKIFEIAKKHKVKINRKKVFISNSSKGIRYHNLLFKNKNFM